MINHRRYLEHIDKDVLVSYLASLMVLNATGQNESVKRQLDYLVDHSTEFEKCYPTAKAIIEDMENES